MASRIDLVGKVFVVTGVGNGMGHELTLELVRCGAQVVTVDMREQALLYLVTIGNIAAVALILTGALM
jgi:NAD(P)-dependent dehydrogenase (short-subunit alcohol dehydrogenase family)